MSEYVVSTGPVERVHVRCEREESNGARHASKNRTYAVTDLAVDEGRAESKGERDQVAA